MTRKLRFSTVVAAVEAPAKTLRKMLQNETLVLPRPPRIGWNDFTVTQLATITIARKFIDFGLSVSDASRLACLVIIDRLILEIIEREKLTVQDFAEAFKNSYAIVHLQNDGPLLIPLQSETWPDLTGTEAAVLVVPVGPIIARALRLAGLSASDDVQSIAADLAAFSEIATTQLAEPAAAEIDKAEEYLKAQLAKRASTGERSTRKGKT